MSSHPSMDESQSRKSVTLMSLVDMRSRGEKITMLTCYDSSFARVLNAAGIDCILVGDSLGMVMQGHSSTLPVSISDVAYHTRCVASVNKASWLIADLPFGSYHESVEQVVRSSSLLMQAGASMVKLEGGGWTEPYVRALVERGIPVCAHLGLTPQSIHALGGFRVQGKTLEQAAVLKRDAKALSDAGASMLVLELIPAHLAAEIQAEHPHLITIGIGAGPETAGQVLVLQDMLGITRGRVPRFVRNFLAGANDVEVAVRNYVSAVKEGTFPGPENYAY
jgi:3-methyl-2-oxobutanoate hydroxymethyltransferase